MATPNAQILLSQSRDSLFCSWVKLLVNDDVPAAQHRGWIGIVRRLPLVIVDKATAIAAIPNPEPEFVCPAATIHLTINGRQHEVIIAAVIDCPNAFELRACASHYQPIIARAIVTDLITKRCRAAEEGGRRVADRSAVERHCTVGIRIGCDARDRCIFRRNVKGDFEP